MADGFATPSLNAQNNSDEIGRRRFSVAELDAMFDANILSRDEKIELVNGEILQINSQMMPHGVIKFRLALKIAGSLPTDLEVQSEWSVKLDEKTLVDPDIAITPRFKIERRYMRPDEIFLAIEVADTTLNYDTKTKALLYATAGIAEYWVVDINGSQTWVHTGPSNRGYATLSQVPFSAALSPNTIAGISIVISSLLT
jgi:Uma2 family endonuclease